MIINTIQQSMKVERIINPQHDGYSFAKITSGDLVVIGDSGKIFLSLTTKLLSKIR